MKKKILIAEDSTLMSSILKDIIDSDPNLEVIGIAKNGKEAQEKIEKLNPDLVTIDIEMPVKDGLTAIREIMTKTPTRFIVISAFAKKEASATIKALEYGAIDFIQKPSGTISPDIKKLHNIIIEKIKNACEVPIERIKLLASDLEQSISHKYPVSSEEKAIVIGSSTGGPKALEIIIPQLSDSLQGYFFIVQHMPSTFTTSFAKRLNSMSKLQVKETEDSEIIQKGIIYIARGDFHSTIEIQNKNYILKLNKDPPLWGVRPSIDIMMDSTAKIFKQNTLGIILTGMGHDGTHGLRMIKENKGKTIVQDKETSLIFGMPYSAIKEGIVDEVVPLFDISQKIVDFFYE